TGVFLSGDKGGYVGVEVGQLRDASRGGSSLLLSLYGAAEISPDFDHRFALCPGVGLSKEFGPRGIGSEKNDYSGTVVYAALDLGVRLRDSRKTSVIPIVGLALTRSRLDIEAQRNPNAVRQSESASESFLAIHAGVGVIVSDRLSITPRVDFPVHSQVQ